MDEICRECAEQAGRGVFNGCAFTRRTGVFKTPDQPEFGVCPMMSVNYPRYPLLYPNGSVWTDEQLGIKR